MERIDYMQVAEEAMDQIRVGAFLTVKAGEALNTMTIGWATIGIVWSRPIFMVAVRLSRHTFSLIEEADDFTVRSCAVKDRNCTRICGRKVTDDVQFHCRTGCANPYVPRRVDAEAFNVVGVEGHIVAGAAIQYSTCIIICGVAHRNIRCIGCIRY